jgi:hypothetical protein
MVLKSCKAIESSAASGRTFDCRGGVEKGSMTDRGSTFREKFGYTLVAG